MAYKRPANSWNDGGGRSKKPFSSPDMKFIAFNQSSTRHDGSASAGSGSQYLARTELARPADIDAVSLIRPALLQEARHFMQGLHAAISRRMNSVEGRSKSMTDNLSHSVQVMNIVVRAKFIFIILYTRL